MRTEETEKSQFKLGESEIKMDIKLDHIIIIGLIGLLAYQQGLLPFAAKPSARVLGQVDACLEGCGGITDTDVVISTIQWVNSTSVDTIAQHILYNDENTKIKAASTIDAYPDEYETLPTCFDGYIMTGEDGGSGTDYYFTKTPMGWSCQGKYEYPNKIKVAKESAVTFTGYDDGTKETTTNITVGTSKVTSTEIKIAADGGECIGNPNLPNPIMLCVNGSSSVLAKFNEIKPTGMTRTNYIPSILTDVGSVKACYILPINALCDGAEDRRYWTIDPISDPVPETDWVDICLIDKNYYENDNYYYEPGWEDYSAYTTASDIGIATTCKRLNFN